MANGHGGKRSGSGRRRGASQKRSRAAAEKVMVDGQLTPLQYVIDVMRDPRTKQKRRDWAASTALPYVHPRLQAIQGDPDKPIVHEHRLPPLEAARRVAYVLFLGTREDGHTLEHEPPQKKVPA